MGTTISGDTGVVFPDATTQSTAVTVATPFSINASAGAGAQLRLPEATANGVNYVAVKAADALAANTTWTLPTADGTSGQYLRTDGAGQLSFATVPTTSPGGTTGQVQINNAGAFGAISEGTSGQVLTSNGAGVAPSFATLASNWVLVASITPTAVSTLTIDNVFTATYENYLVYFQGTSVTSNGAYSTMRFIDRSTGSPITSDYYSINGWTSGSTGLPNQSDMAGPLRNAMSSGTNFPPGSEMLIFNASKNPSYFGRQVNYYSTSGSIYFTSGGATTATSGIRGFSLTLSAGTFVAQGKILIFGMKA